MLAAFLLVYKKFSSKELNSIFPVIQTGISEKGFLVLFVLLLMPLNWFLEAIKWKWLMRVFFPVSIAKAIKATLAGLAVSAVMPLRVGEFAGRMLLVPNTHRVEAGTTTVAANFLQYLCTIGFGLMGLYSIPFVLQGIPVVWISVGIVTLAALSVWYLFRLKSRKSYKTRKVFYVLYSVKKRMWGKIMIWSVLRYVVFSSQYVILLWIFTGHSNLVELYAGVAVIFLVQSIMPGFILADLGIRVGVPVMVFSSMPVMLVTSAALILYIINIIVPVCLGALVVIFEKRLLEDTE